MESVLLLKPDFLQTLSEKGYSGWMNMAQDMGLLYHFILIVVGLLVCYYGYRMYRVVVITFGALIGAFLGLMVMDALGLSGTGASVVPNEAIYGIWDYLGFIGGAVLGGAAFWWLSWIAVIVLGFYGCAFIGYFALVSITPQPVAYGIAASMGIVGALLSWKFFKPFVIVLTALLGAFDFAMGVAGVLVATNVVSVMTGDNAMGVWAFILPFVLMIILGIVNQVIDNYREEYVADQTSSNDEVPATT